MTKTFNCICEEKEHELDTRFPVWDYVANTIEHLGENVKITYTKNMKTYLVPRIYISFHGITGKELDKLGFKEI